MNRRSILGTAVALSLSVAVGCAVKACSSPELVETFGEKSEGQHFRRLNSRRETVP